MGAGEDRERIRRRACQGGEPVRAVGPRRRAPEEAEESRMLALAVRAVALLLVVVVVVALLAGGLLGVYLAFHISRGRLGWRKRA